MYNFQDNVCGDFVNLNTCRFGMLKVLLGIECACVLSYG